MIGSGRDELADRGAAGVVTPQQTQTMVNDDDAAMIAAAFVGARRTATALADYPGTEPASLAQSYAIQDRAIAQSSRPIGGWKVGRIHEPQASALGTTRLAGPIFADTIVHADPQSAVVMPVFAGGFAAVEAEMLLRVSRYHAQPAALDDQAILDLVDAVHVGIEIASSPFAGINALGPLVTISDFGNNAGLVVGPALPDWQSRDLAQLHARLSINGIEQGEGDMTTLPGGPIESVRFLLANLAERGLTPSGPLWISAGAISGVHIIEPGSEAVACFGGDWTVRCATINAIDRSI